MKNTENSSGDMLEGTVRLKFAKTGRLKFISHLDLQRTFKTTLNRAKLPIWYTEGFNPRPKLVFGLPLSIGVESLCEFLDIRLTSPVSREDIINSVNANSTDELKITDAYPAQRKLNEIYWAKYEVVSNELENINASDILKGEIIVSKHSKKGEKTFDIMPLIKSFSQSGNKLTMTLCAESENYLNPDHVIKQLGTEDYTVLRTNVYLSDGVTEFN